MRRILSIDGGGVRGALTTCALIELERQTGKPCRQIFDMVAGTSTGALIAAAIAVGLPAERILAIYQKRSGEIFNHGAVQAWLLRIERGWAYDPHNLAAVLRSEFGIASDWKLNDCPIRVLLTAKHVSFKPLYFVQDTPKNARLHGAVSLVDAAVASSCAPTYHDGWYVEPSGTTLEGWCYDGGVGIAGNPCYRALREAFQYDDFDPAATQMISLGTGYYPNPQVNRPQGLYATIAWAVGALASAPIDEQTDLAQYHYPGIMHRSNWELPRAIDEADVAAIPELITLGKQFAAQLDWKSILQGEL